MQVVVVCYATEKQWERKKVEDELKLTLGI